MEVSSRPRFFLLALFVCSLLAFAACSTPPGNPEEGKKWFAMHNCTSCHGPHGNDGKAPSVVGLDMGFSGFLRKLRTTDAPIMPPYPESSLTKQDAADIYAFLKNSR
jgi:mono/diheme cytochrome c family protein